MCRKPARAATGPVASLAVGLAVALCAAGAGTPAYALFGHSKPKPEAEAQAQPKAQPKAEAETAPEAPRKATPEQRKLAERLAPLARAAFWAREVEADPRDTDAGVALARALRELGRYEEAMRASDLVLVAAPNDMEALLESARDKIAGQQGFYAIELLNRARGLAPKDWRPVSLLGVALEQSQRPDEALKAFGEALALSPDNPAVLSNLGLFYAARGQAPVAETYLRQAVAAPGATAQERQNLALVLGLQGKIAEAEPLLRRDLPPDVANANLAYLREAAAPGVQAAPASRTWGALEGAQTLR